MEVGFNGSVLAMRIGLTIFCIVVNLIHDLCRGENYINEKQDENTEGKRRDEIICKTVRTRAGTRGDRREKKKKKFIFYNSHLHEETPGKRIWSLLFFFK